MQRPKVLVVFYSRTGSNRKLALSLKKKLRAEYEEIVEEKERAGKIGFFYCGLDTLLNRGAKIRKPKEDPSDYNLAVLVTPIWVGRMPPAVRAYLAQNREKFKNLALLSVSKSGTMNPEAVSDFERHSGKKPVCTLLLKEKDVEKRTHEKRFEGFIRELESFV
jgi:flavodoxin